MIHVLHIVEKVFFTKCTFQRYINIIPISVNRISNVSIFGLHCCTFIFDHCGIFYAISGLYVVETFVCLTRKSRWNCNLLVLGIQLPLSNTSCAVYVWTYKLVVLTIFQHQNKNALQSKSFKRKIYILLLLFRILC